MPSRPHVALAATALALMLYEPIAARALPKLTAEQSQIVDTVSTVFAAARTDDVAKFDSVIAPDFYIFDAGARFNGDSIMAFIKAQHLAGRRRHREPELAGISRPSEAGRCVENRLHAQHSRHHGNSKEPWQMTIPWNRP